jgi:iron complex outermembrane recepter protein
MKTNRLLARLAATLALVIAPAGAADAGTGTIQGRVQNARTGEYIERARLQMTGMNLETFTDEGGFYRFTQVPTGEISIETFFTGLPAAVVRVTVTPGAVVERDIMVGSADPAAPVKLAEFVVDVSREMAASAIAINEQRFAPNIKNVVSTDEFGYVPEGNAADFLKFLPGISIDVVGGNSREVSINGAPAENVPITLDGFNMASSGVGNVNTTRTVAMDMFSVNNVARIEVEYTPTPESQGSALAGSVNMVPRSAFERSRPVLNVSAFVMMRSNEHGFHRTPGPRQSPSRKFDPGFDFAYVMPSTIASASPFRGARRRISPRSR